MVTSITPIIQQYTPRAHSRVGDRSAYVTLEPDAYLDSTTSTTQLAKQTHASPHVPITNGTDSYHRNHQYSVTAVTTSTGTIAERYAYSAYGQPTVLDASGLPLSPQVSSLNNRYSYTGREWDATLGLHHFRARWMSPSAGRFLTRDPIGYEGSEWSLYEFVKSRPLILLDPMGLVGSKGNTPFCDTICAKAAQVPANIKSGGGVFCNCESVGYCPEIRCNKCACIFDSPINNVGRCPAVDKCGLEHEVEHLGSITCFVDLGIVQKGPENPKIWLDEECKLRKKEVACLEAALAGEKNNFCQLVAKVIIKVQKKFLDDKCKNVGIK